MAWMVAKTAGTQICRASCQCTSRSAKSHGYALQIGMRQVHNFAPYYIASGFGYEDISKSQEVMTSRDSFPSWKDPSDLRLISGIVKAVGRKVTCRLKYDDSCNPRKC
mmetsp:Transcript_11362/g.25032  ORF Transcript_11362/g.25032 Transcript_11362/m.25032 type:complete len:108 (-) Transcript_11362:1788-2111(-)